ncbi:efflux RND transporter periplasmic adaptor subunit [Permianibacter sp. IMCC34836]|uniref:efflux RND transporter periplasmic adaptor subunit n=1 Tax=Permianibacter fluminis TaxID=2738515 RepID=UPI001552A138|nr:efflux RND transporter periplasmic adaptor subunit [Permianibacter fluminis]NQD36111.1 efflux RND transporter periplasmic adaptor subunit [Permianibacter fluminis]
MNKQIPLYVLLAGLTVYAGSLWWRGGGGDGAGKERPPVPVTLMAATMRPMGDVVTALGTAEAREGVVITAEQAGLVEQIHFRDGDTVGKGQLLITLHDDEQQAKLREAEAKLLDQRNQFARLQNLAKEQAVARSTLDERESTLKVAEAQLAVARADLDKRYIRAPFAGVLGARQVSPGALVTPGMQITTLDDISTVKVEFTVPETLASFVRRGMSLNAHSAALGDKPFIGKLSHVDTRINPSTRTLSLRAEIDNPQRDLKPGMLIDLQISRDEGEALSVPEGALLSVANQHFVYLVNGDNVAHQTAVQTGRRRVGFVEVLAGLKNGDQVVVEGIHKVRDGQKVAPVAGVPAADAATHAS